MGIFSKKTITTKTSTHMNLFSEVPNVTQDVMLSTLGDRAIKTFSDMLTDEFRNGAYRKSEDYYRYGRDHTKAKLPSSDIGYSLVPSVNTKASIRAEFGIQGKITILSLVYDLAEPVFFKRHFPSHKYHAHEYYYHTSFLVGSSKEPVYWYYRELSGKYPDMTTTKKNKGTSPYYPVVPVLVNGHNVGHSIRKHEGVDDQGEPVILPTPQAELDKQKQVRDADPIYLERAEMFKRLGLPYGDVCDGIYSSEWAEKTQGDVDAFFSVKAAALSKEPAVITYLAHYFYQMSLTTVANLDDRNAWEKSSGHMYNKGTEDAPEYVTFYDRTPPINTITVSESWFKQQLTYNYIETSVVKSSKDITGSELKIRDKLHIHGDSYNDMNHITYTARVAGTSDTFIKVKVHGLFLSDFVRSGHIIETNLQNAYENGNKMLMVPMHRAALAELTIVDRNQCMYSCMTVTMYSFHQRKQHWMETWWGKLVGWVITIVMAILTWWAGGAGGALVGLAWNIAIAVVIKAVVMVVVDLIGPEAAGILAAIVIVAAVVLQQYDLVLTEMQTMAMDSLATLGAGLASAVNESYMDLMTAINKELAAFMGDHEGRMNELADIEAELDAETGIKTEYLLQQNRRFTPAYLFEEAPKTYYARTLEYDPWSASNNSGIMYHPSKLSLPTVDQSFKQFKRT